MTELSQIIRAEVSRQGAIPFARFMELALYCPEFGFYERESDTVGRAGHFYTSVSVGPLFGELLAGQFASWLAGAFSGPVQIVEAGAHDGKLAADILRWLQRWRPELWGRVEYVVLEPSPRRRGWQQRTLAEFGQRVRWVETDLAALPGAFQGILFSNELLDALPVHRLGWDATRQTWFEWGVTVNGDQFAWARLERLSQELLRPTIPEAVLATMPDGYAIDICPQAAQWWANAAQALRLGWLLTFDYGGTAEELISPHRTEGTLRAYRQHRVSQDVLADPGGQDLTAHVDFSRLRAIGESIGWQTEVFARQGTYLAGLAQPLWAEMSAAGAWRPAAGRELQTLLHPEHLGRAFHVLVQCRATAAGLTDNRVGHLA